MVVVLTTCFTRLKNYPLQTGSWVRQMYGTAATVMGDEVMAMTAIMENFKQITFKIQCLDVMY